MTTPVAQHQQAEPVVFPTQEILSVAQGNLTGWILAPARYCRDRGIPFEEWVLIMGRLHAPLWDKEEYKSPLIVARRMALHFLSAGATDVGVMGDESRAEMTYRWPSDGWLAAFGLSRREVRGFPRFFEPIAEHLGLHFEYAAEGDRTRLVFAR